MLIQKIISFVKIPFLLFFSEMYSYDPSKYNNSVIVAIRQREKEYDCVVVMTQRRRFYELLQ